MGSPKQNEYRQRLDEILAGYDPSHPSVRVSPIPFFRALAKVDPLHFGEGHWQERWLDSLHERVHQLEKRFHQLEGQLRNVDGYLDGRLDEIEKRVKSIEEGVGADPG